MGVIIPKLYVFARNEIEEMHSQHGVVDKQFVEAMLFVYVYEVVHGAILRHRNKGEYLMLERYLMDANIIRQTLQEIVDTGQYTLEGIAQYTRIPFDVLLDVACGRTDNFFVTSWVRVMKLYIQVKPEMAQKVVDRILAMNDNKAEKLSRQLQEMQV